MNEDMPDKTGLITTGIFLIKDETALLDKMLFEKLSDQINYLLLHDFEKLVSILYRIDVNESRLKAMIVNQQDTASADIIAQLVIDRQLEKIRSRQQYRRDNNIADEERW